MDTPHDKLDKLDKLAHHGVIDDPSYYACIQEQFSFFSKVVDKVEELFQKYHRVIITGDHGSSRLAARFSMQGKATLRQHLLRCAVMVDFVFLMELKSLLAPIK